MRKEFTTVRARPLGRGWGTARFLFFACLAFFSFLVPEPSSARERAAAARLLPAEAHVPRPGVLLAQRHQSDRFRNRYEQWQKMAPDEKETLRRRMDQWKQMAPQDQQRYRQRFDQWKGLSPDEQRQIDRKLDRWKDLSPAEKEDVRKKFR
jgi:hypothetical protein